MNLRGIIKKVLKEQTNFSPQFKRRIMLFKEFIKHCTPMLYPCDYENFYHFMQGIYSEVEEYSSGIYDYDDDNPTPDWLTYEEGTEFIETYMLDDLKSHYDKVCQNQDLNEQEESNDPDYSPEMLITLRKMVAKMDLPSVRDVKVRWNERGGSYIIGLYYENNTDTKLIEKNENKVWSMIPFFGLPYYSVLPQSYYINPEEN
jgi:hypothetical protein